MAAANGRTGAGLSDQLFDEPYRFNFFQAVRLLERLLRERAQEDARWPEMPVGQDHPPERECVRFRAAPALSFPASTISQIRQPPPPSSGNGEVPPPEMTVAFLGLTGPLGVLPHHYTTLILRRARDKDFALRDFLDLYNHRLISLFYRAWEKYRVPFAYERSQLDPSAKGQDLCTRALYCLVGLGTGALRGRVPFVDEAFLFYSGLFAHYPRAASSLEAILGDYFQVPVRVHQLQGQWLCLGPEDRSLLPTPEHPKGRNNALGVNVVAGERIWDIQSKFRLRIGPLTYREFRGFMPNGDALRPLCEFARAYVGPELDFDVQPVLKPEEVPWCQLKADEDNPPFLGWNTWVRCQEFSHEVDNTVFSLESI